MQTKDELKIKVLKCCGGNGYINAMIENPTPENYATLYNRCSIPGWHHFVTEYFEACGVEGFENTIEGTENDPICHIKVLNTEIPHDDDGNVIIEEIPAEENVEEKVEEKVEETPAEEVPAEEVPTEETPAEEVPAEEAPVEETQTKKPRSKKKK